MTPLSARGAFNSTVRHIKKALRVLDALEGGENFADALRRPGLRGLSNPDSLSLLRLLLVDKLGYTALSGNPPGFAGDIPALAAEFAGWNAVDLVAVFHDPRFLRILNPKNADQLAALGRPFPRELLVVYAGSALWDLSRDVAVKAARTAIALLSGARPEIPPEFRSAPPKGTPKQSAPRGESPGPPRRTPLYSVPVSNELFHYGNVEAWKRVIGDYENARPGCKVHVYYDGEPILDINALFTWGKVRRGRVLQFAVSSPGAIHDTAKLRRRLVQASGRDFEPLLGGPSTGALS
ncbi:MAG: hypothetical protein LBU16_04960 [Treponema sp.]|jgi:hypothetical protein|nr:hypothetical protein [Treponema sp.]